MRIFKLTAVLFFAFALCLVPTKDVFAGIGGAITLPETDNNIDDTGFSSIFYVFDLRDRETFIQLTYPDGEQTGLPATAHVQIFDVSNNCTENNFFDSYTINDTHVYNIRDIQTNDGNNAGVVLPDGAYGIVAVTMVSVIGSEPEDSAGAFGNVRIIDNNGYEYRTNAQALYEFADGLDVEDTNEIFYSFNFNEKSGVSLSDVFGISLYAIDFPQFELEWTALPVQGVFSPFDIDIVDLDETIFSCRDIVFSCVNQDSNLLDEVLAISLGNVASFEYGINNAIPHSKGGELLCPGNSVAEGSVILRPEAYPNTEAFIGIIETLNPIESDLPFFFGFVGLNNGNGRGSMDSFWVFNFVTAD